MLPDIRDNLTSNIASFVFPKFLVMTCIEKTNSMFMILRSLSFMWQRFVKNTARARAQQTIYLVAKVPVSARELHKPVCWLNFVSSSQVSKALKNSKQVFVYHLQHFSLSKTLHSKTKTWKQWRWQILAMPPSRRPNACFERRRDVERQLPEEIFSPNVVYRLHWGAQSFFGTKVMATVVVTFTREVKKCQQSVRKSKSRSKRCSKLIRDVCYEKLEPFSR